MAASTDLDQLVELVSKSTGLMTTMPRTPAEVTARLVDAVRFDDTFLMVLVEDERIIGLSAIYADLGRDRPFYSYKMVHLTKSSPELAVKVGTNVLHLVNDFTGASELGTLFLDPDYRGGGRGKLLSYSRLMFMARHRELFGDRVMAELRGWTDSDGRSPFWEAVGKKFFQLDLDEADLLSGREYRFISDLMPAYPIYVNLLPQAAQEVIGVPHQGSAPAMAMLGKQGLRYRRYVDIFDAGPSIDAHIADIPMIRHSRQCEVHALASGSASRVGGTHYVAAGTLADFRVATMIGRSDSDWTMVEPGGLDVLELDEGDEVMSYEVKG